MSNDIYIKLVNYSDGWLSGITFTEYGSSDLQGLLSEQALSELDIFGKSESTGFLAIWTLPDGRQPVVYVCDDGLHKTIAPNFRSFVLLLGIGYPDIRCLDTSRLPAFENEDERQSSQKLKRWIESEFDCLLPTTGDELFGKNWQHDLPSFADWVDYHWVQNEPPNYNLPGYGFGLWIVEKTRRWFRRS